MVFLPEYGDFVAQNVRQTFELAEPIDGPTVQHYCRLAQSLHIWIALGGFHIKASTFFAKAHPLHFGHLIAREVYLSHTDCVYFIQPD